MNFEDSRYALFSEPNAYVNKDVRVKTQAKKVVFSEPYETLPNYHINNNFNKKYQNKNAETIKNPKHFQNNENRNYQNNENRNQNAQNFHSNNSISNPLSSLAGQFNLQGLLPLISKLFSSNANGLGNVLSVLNNQNNQGGGLASLLSNPEVLNSAIGLFKNFNNKKPNKIIENKIKSTDFLIKDYVKVDD